MHTFHFLKNKMQKLNKHECEKFLGSNFVSAQMGISSIHLNFITSADEDLGVTVMCPFFIKLDNLIKVGNGEDPATISFLYELIGKTVSIFQQDIDFSLQIDFENIGCLRIDRRSDGFESYLVNIPGDTGGIAVF